MKMALRNDSVYCIKEFEIEFAKYETETEEVR